MYPAKEFRKERRYGRRLFVQLVMVSESGEPIKEDTFTLNISRGGACVLSELPLDRGRYLQVLVPGVETPTLAAVRERRRENDLRSRLHLQFVNREWAVTGI